MKKLLGVDLDGSWTFTPDNAGLGTIQFNGVNLRLEQILLITNTTRNAIIYNFADATKGATAFGSNTLTLTADTSMDNFDDSLQIYVDVDAPTEIDAAPQSGLAMLLTRILAAMLAPLGYRKDLQRYMASTILESGTVTTVSTVTTVTTASNLVNMNGLASDRLILNQNYSAWAAVHRARIT